MNRFSSHNYINSISKWDWDRYFLIGMKKNKLIIRENNNHVLKKTGTPAKNKWFQKISLTIRKFDCTHTHTFVGDVCSSFNYRLLLVKFIRNKDINK